MLFGMLSVCRSDLLPPIRNANVLSGALVTDGKGEWSLSTILVHNKPYALVASRGGLEIAHR